MEISALVDRFPRVHHVTTGGAWDRIAATGLLSTSALLDRFEVPEPRRSALESRPRPEAVELAHPSHGRAVIFDNRPLRLDILRKCLDCSARSGADCSTPASSAGRPRVAWRTISAREGTVGSAGT
jgi:hypothetical protein